MSHPNFMNVYYVVKHSGSQLVGVFTGPLAAVQYIVNTVDFFFRKDYTVHPATFHSDGQLHTALLSLNGADEELWSMDDFQIRDRFNIPKNVMYPDAWIGR